MFFSDKFLNLNQEGRILNKTWLAAQRLKGSIAVFDKTLFEV